MNNQQLLATFEDMLPAAAYQKVEQVAPIGIVVDFERHKTQKRDYNTWWHYSI
jgi:hypothetical protein